MDLPNPKTVARLTLVGTVHRDPQGEERLLRLLEELHPSQVTVEVSAAALAYRAGNSRLLLRRLEGIVKRLARDLETEEPELLRHPAVSDIRSLLEIPFEYRAARRCGERSGAEVTPIDLDDISSTKLRRVEAELITYRNLRTLLRMEAGSAEQSREDYRLARNLVAEGAAESLRAAFLARRRGAEGVGRRDQHMATAIRRRLEIFPQGRLVHIGGWVHLVDDPRGETLFSRLADLHPDRRLLF